MEAVIDCHKFKNLVEGELRFIGITSLSTTLVYSFTKIVAQNMGADKPIAVVTAVAAGAITVCSFVQLKRVAIAMRVYYPYPSNPLGNSE